MTPSRMRHRGTIRRAHDETRLWPTAPRGSALRRSSRRRRAADLPRPCRDGQPGKRAIQQLGGVRTRVFSLPAIRSAASAVEVNSCWKVAQRRTRTSRATACATTISRLPLRRSSCYANVSSPRIPGSDDPAPPVAHSPFVTFRGAVNLSSARLGKRRDGEWSERLESRATLPICPPVSAIPRRLPIKKMNYVSK